MTGVAWTWFHRYAIYARWNGGKESVPYAKHKPQIATVKFRNATW